MSALLKNTGFYVTHNDEVQEPALDWRLGYYAAFETHAYGHYYSQPDIFNAVLQWELPDLGGAKLGFKSIPLPPRFLRQARYDGELDPCEIRALRQGLDIIKSYQNSATELLLVEGRLAPRGRRDCDHSLALAVDFANRKFFIHDPAGKTVRLHARRIIGEAFPSMQLHVSTSGKQDINFSCALITLEALTCYAEYGAFRSFF